MVTSIGHPFQSSATLAAAGFQGFESVVRLRADRLRSVPQACGVYALVREPHQPPEFLGSNPGGRFKGRDPTVPSSTLTEAWVKDAVVLYIGKAGGPVSAATLRKRLTQLLDFGGGKPVGHWGGRYLWQLAGIEDSRICWRECPEDDPRAVERDLLAQFAAVYGKQPYANIAG